MTYTHTHIVLSYTICDAGCAGSPAQTIITLHPPIGVLLLRTDGVDSVSCWYDFALSSVMLSFLRNIIVSHLHFIVAVMLSAENVAQGPARCVNYVCVHYEKLVKTL